MDINNLKPNTDEYLNSQKPKYIQDIEPAVDKENTLERKSAFVRLIEAATGREIGNLRKYILNKVLLPWFFDSVHDGFEGVNDAIFGRGRSVSRSRDPLSYWDSKKPSTRRDYSKVDIASDYRNPVLDTREEAMAVKDRLIRLFEEDHVAGITIANVYRVARINHDTTNWTLMNYGWNSVSDIEQSYIEKKYSGSDTKYILVLPKPRRLN